MLKFIVSVHYEEFVFSDGCAALAYAEISKKTAKNNVRVQMYIESERDEEIEKDGDEA